MVEAQKGEDGSLLLFPIFDSSDPATYTVHSASLCHTCLDYEVKWHFTPSKDSPLLIKAITPEG